MADILFVLVSLAFFGLCALYVRGCERIIGGSEDTAPRGRDHVRAHRRVVVTADNIVGLILAVLLAGYLVAALLLPERF